MRRLMLTSTIALALLAAACGDEGSTAPSQPPTGPLAAYLASSAPAGAKDVLAARAAAKPGDELVVRGRVKDFITNRAAVIVIDSSKPSCDEAGPMADCPTPWDFCCDPPDEINAASIAVEVRDASGTLKQGLEGFGGLAHLDTLVVAGKFERDERGNDTLVAKHFWIEKRVNK